MKRPAAYVLMMLSILGASCPFGPGDDTLELEGHVHASISCPRTGNDPCVPSGPAVSGAVVSTSLDAETAVTDAAGHFELKSGSTPDVCEKFTIMISANGYPTYAVTRMWGFRSRDQLFGLAPPSPDETNDRCDR